MSATATVQLTTQSLLYGNSYSNLNTPSTIQPLTVTILLPLLASVYELGWVVVAQYAPTIHMRSTVPISRPSSRKHSLLAIVPNTVELLPVQLDLASVAQYTLNVHTHSAVSIATLTSSELSVSAIVPETVQATLVFATPTISFASPTKTIDIPVGDDSFLSPGLKYALLVICCIGMVVAASEYVRTITGQIFTPRSSAAGSSRSPDPWPSKDGQEGTAGNGQGGKDDGGEEEKGEEEGGEEGEKEKEEDEEEEDDAAGVESSGSPGEPGDPDGPPDPSSDPQNDASSGNAPQISQVLQCIVLAIAALVLVKRLDLFEQFCVPIWHAWRRLARRITKKLGVQYVARDVRETVVNKLMPTTPTTEVSVSPVLDTADAIIETTTNTSLTAADTSVALVVATAMLPALQLVMAPIPPVVPNASLLDTGVLREEGDRFNALMGLLGVEPICVVPRNMVVEMVLPVVREDTVIEIMREEAPELYEEEPEPVPTDAKGWLIIAVHAAAIMGFLGVKKLVDRVRWGAVVDATDLEEVDAGKVEDEVVDDDAAHEVVFFAAGSEGEHPFECDSIVAAAAVPLSEKEQELLATSTTTEEIFFSFDLSPVEGSLEEGIAEEDEEDDDFLSFVTVAEEDGKEEQCEGEVEEEEEEFMSFGATTMADEDGASSLEQGLSIDFTKFANECCIRETFPFTYEDDLDAWFAFSISPQPTPIGAIPLVKDAEPTLSCPVDASVVSEWVTLDVVDGDAIEGGLETPGCAEELEEVESEPKLLSEEELLVAGTEKTMAPNLAPQEEKNALAITTSISLDIASIVDTYWLGLGKDETSLLGPSFSMEAALGMMSPEHHEDEQDIIEEEMARPDEVLECMVELERAESGTAEDAKRGEVETFVEEEEETEVERTRRAEVADGKKKELPLQTSTPASTRNSSLDPLVPPFTPVRRRRIVPATRIPILPRPRRNPPSPHKQLRSLGFWAHNPRAAIPIVNPTEEKADAEKPPLAEISSKVSLNPNAIPFQLPLSSSFTHLNTPPAMWSPCAPQALITITTPLTAAERREARRASASSASESPSSMSRMQRKRHLRRTARIEDERHGDSVDAGPFSGTVGICADTDTQSSHPVARRQSSPPPFIRPHHSSERPGITSSSSVV
ncbi:hypothetical protein Hypma_012582 [Hypsizygus marmoreus]|uniref:Uncharacterized protein n=1 Tax=Hypsizygus marmoreus TaxID=39966 RepID=A0A369JED8_HYPMA|nr:hypothetical protein Hypma_012582 [Hypsizygus marmoreus]